VKFLCYFTWQTGKTSEQSAECAGLQATKQNHILIPEHLYKWATENIIGITSFYVIQREIKEHVCWYIEPESICGNQSFRAEDIDVCCHDMRQLIQMSDNPDQNMKNAVHSWVSTSKDTCHLERQMSHLSVQTKLDSFFKPALLCSKTSTTSESSIDD
jgi:hypothetical protein